MRVVIDTNVIVSAMRSSAGQNRQVLRACLQGRLQPVVGQALFSEYEDLLRRESVFAGTPLTLAERQELLDAFLHTAEWVRVYYLWRPNLRDEADNHVLELAVAGSAGVIVTNNLGDFQRTDLRFPGIRILRPDDIMKELR